MYKFMNLWKSWGYWIFNRGFPWDKFFKPEITRLMKEQFKTYIVVPLRQTTKLLPIGHRWRGDVTA